MMWCMSLSCYVMSLHIDARSVYLSFKYFPISCRDVAVFRDLICSKSIPNNNTRFVAHSTRYHLHVHCDQLPPLSVHKFDWRLSV